MSGDGSEVGGFVTGDSRRPVVPQGETLQPLDPVEFGEDKPRWPIAWFAFAAVFALTGATALILPHLVPVFGAHGPGPTPSAQASSSHVAVACLVDPHDAGYCSRYAKDVVRRTPLTAAERRLRGPESRQIEGTVLGVHPSPGQAPADALRAALSSYPGAVVRVARPDDPAPAGSVIFAVPLGSDCVVGFTRDGPGGGTSVLVGQLPDRRCLSA